MTYVPSFPLLLIAAYFLAFGGVTIIGGMVGYIKARSIASLVAGSASGLFLLLGDFLLWSGHSKPGAILLLVVSLALLGRFTPALLRGKLNPAAYLAPLSLIGTILAAVALYAAQ